ncbi:MAG: DNA cytosine methyltransferase [Nanoarchaeota archaeon]|nr:DNA cytosine methyltransferase [Nanoarchaeota archaeon]
MSDKKRMTVADFFCGAGGFSEGFRQKGFDVVFALDNWKPAIDTHQLNHPKCKHVLMDILELDTPEKIDSVVPDTDIIIGSPPCVAFSWSNKAGKADKSFGIKLIKAYLRIIAWKKKRGVVKYWLLENVPNSGNHIKEEYSWEELGLPGKGPKLQMQQRNVFNAADYGAPQTRKRFVCGDYIVPKITNDESQYIHMRDVFEKLGNPFVQKSSVVDPVYGFSLHSSKLTDHYYDSKVEEFEWKNAKRLKEDHGFMGKMSFPENLDRPSRTVMATMSASTRESMIFSSFDKTGKKKGYRLPTIREIAAFMSFPITYQFEATNEGSKYRLVGNAVCAKLSGALAQAIAKEEGMKIPEKFLPLPDVEPSVNLNGRKRENKELNTKRSDAKFVMHVPYIKTRSFRVELNNLESDFNKNKIEWNSVLHQGTGKGAMRCNARKEEVESLVKNLEDFKDFKKNLVGTFKGKLSSTNLQKSHCLNDDSNSPVAILEIIRTMVDKHFPEEKYCAVELDNSKRAINIGKDRIPARIATAFYACNYFTSLLD